MKFYNTLLAASSLLSLADAQSELFMKSDDGAAMATELDEQQVKTGFCQVMINYDFYDLKAFDELGRNKVAKSPAVSPAGDGSFFFYKLCQPHWKLTEESFKLSGSADPFPAECGATDAAAFLFTGGKCPYTFENPFIDGLMETVDGEEQSKGFTLDFLSKQKCEKDPSANFAVKFSAKCNKDGDSTVVYDKTEDCSVTYNFEGKEACKLYSVNIDKYMDIISPYIGAILIVIGAVMTFFGAKFLVQLFSTMVWLLFTSGLFLIVYNFFLSSENTNLPIIIGVGVVCSLVGLGVAYFSFKFAKDYSVPLLAAWGGIVAALQLLKMGKVENGSVEIVGAIVGALLGGYFGNKSNKFVKCVGTAFVGAFFITKGASFYLGGFPSSTNAIDSVKDGSLKEEGPLFWGYFGSFVVLTIGGSIMQLYLFRDDDVDKDDMFEAQDEGRTCGCF